MEPELLKLLQDSFRERVGLVSDFTLALRHDVMHQFIMTLDETEKKCI